MKKTTLLVAPTLIMIAGPVFAISFDESGFKRTPTQVSAQSASLAAGYSDTRPTLVKAILAALDDDKKTYDEAVADGIEAAKVTVSPTQRSNAVHRLFAILPKEMSRQQFAAQVKTYAANEAADALLAEPLESPVDFLSKVDFMLGTSTRAKVTLARSNIEMGTLSTKITLLSSLPIASELDLGIIKYSLLDSDAGLINFSINNAGTEQSRSKVGGACPKNALAPEDGCFYRWGIGFKALSVTGTGDTYTPALYAVWGLQTLFGGNTVDSSTRNSTFGFSGYVMGTYLPVPDKFQSALSGETLDKRSMSLNLDAHYAVTDRLQLNMGWALSSDDVLNQRAYVSLKLLGTK